MSKNKSVPSGYGAKDSMGRLTIQGVYSELKARVDEPRLRIEHGLHQVEADRLADKHQRELDRVAIDIRLVVKTAVDVNRNNVPDLHM